MSVNLRRILWCGLLAGLGLVWLAGCGTPQERYHTLSIFFDGVPNPDTIKKQPNGDQATVQVMVRTVKQHPPYRDNKCDVCHRSSSGELQDFSLAYNQCVKCHKTVAAGHKLMHGPVAREDCKWCHTPHESAEPALLKASPVKVCTQCHDKQLLGAKPAEHLDGTTSCLQCHSGHGGDARYFLKAATQPAAAIPESLPATHPALRLPLELAPAEAPAPSTAPAKERTP